MNNGTNPDSRRPAHAVDSITRNSHADQLLKALDDHALVSITDAEGKLIHVNARFCAVSGFSAREVLGLNPRFLKSGQHSPAWYRELWSTLQAGNTWRGRLCNRRRDGSLFWVETTLVPFMDAGGRPECFVAIGTDITDIKASEQDIAALKNTELALIAARDEAERANEAKSHFLSSMSHELRTPLNAILGFSQLLKDHSTLDSEQRDSMAEIFRAGEHLLELINEVLDLARIESGKVDLALEPVHCVEVIDECIGLVNPIAEQMGIDIRFSHTPDVVVTADYTRLKQVLVNLLSNAIKYNHPLGHVVISISQQGGKARVEVSDTGPGISPERQQELFQPFARLGAETTDVEGTGIGLSISRRLMELMGGAIGMHCEAGEGSTFWISLPVHAEEPAQPVSVVPPEASVAAVASTHRHKVMYVEDNAVNLKLVEQILATRPHVRLVKAQTPWLAIELAMVDPPDLILLDINLPGMDGYKLLSMLRSNAGTADVPVVAVSAYAMQSDIDRGLKAGFIAYLTKPLTIARLLEVVDGLLVNRA